MVNIIGSPDYVKRAGLSAAKLSTVTLNNDVTSSSSIIDTNGFSYVIVTVINNASTDICYTQFLFFDTSGGSVITTVTYVVPLAGTTLLIKLPASARYFGFTQINLSGTDHTTTTYYVYGTNADTDKLYAFDASRPISVGNLSIGAGTSTTVNFPFVFGGQVCFQINQDTNNKWTATFSYYDYSMGAFQNLSTIHGTDHGQSYDTFISLPFAPVRINVQNTDTVTHNFTYSVVAA